MRFRTSVVLFIFASLLTPCAANVCLGSWRLCELGLRFHFCFGPPFLSWALRRQGPVGVTFVCAGAYRLSSQGVECQACVYFVFFFVFWIVHFCEVPGAVINLLAGVSAVRCWVAAIVNFLAGVSVVRCSGAATVNLLACISAASCLAATINSCGGRFVGEALGRSYRQISGGCFFC